MGRRRTVAVVAGALVALGSSVAVLAAPGGRAERVRPLTPAAEPGLEKTVNDVRARIERAIRAERAALESDSNSEAVSFLKRARDDLGRARDGLPSATSFQADSHTFAWIDSVRSALDRAIKVDDVVLGVLKSPDESVDDEQARIRRAIAYKQQALDFLPKSGDSGCQVAQSTTKSSVSITVSGCKQPVSEVTFQFPQATTLLGYSPKGKAACKPSVGKTVSCQLKLPLMSLGELRIDVKPAGSPVVTTTWKPSGSKNVVAIDSQKPVPMTTTTPAPDDPVAKARAQIEAAVRLEQQVLAATKWSSGLTRPLADSIELLEQASDSLLDLYEAAKPEARPGLLWMFAAATDLRLANQYDRDAAGSLIRETGLARAKTEIRRALEKKQQALAKITTRSTG